MVPTVMIASGAGRPDTSGTWANANAANNTPPATGMARRSSAGGSRIDSCAPIDSPILSHAKHDGDGDNPDGPVPFRTIETAHRPGHCRHDDHDEPYRQRRQWSHDKSRHHGRDRHSCGHTVTLFQLTISAHYSVDDRAVRCAAMHAAVATANGATCTDIRPG